MILESLLELVETLKARIDKHGYQFQDSEALTRYALIDPLLRELGWNTEDPKVVRPEYYVGNNSHADYVLFVKGMPTIVVESKSLSEPLRDGKAFEQGGEYCDQTNSGYFLLTDGRRWELYESGKATSVVDFDLKDQAPADVCRRALVLWRPLVTSNSEIRPPNGQSESKNTNDLPASPNGEWVPLTGGIETKDMQPIRLKFPCGKPVRLEYWNELMTRPTRWLLKRGHLTRDLLPVYRSDNPDVTYYLVSTTSVRPNGKPMGKKEKVSAGIWVDKDFTGMNCVKNAITIIKKTGQDPSKFSVLTKPRRKNFPR